MKREEVHRRLTVTAELGEIVRTLRVLSRSRLVQARRVAARCAAYEAGVRAAFSAALALRPVPPGVAGAPDGATTAVIALGSEHGFVGALNERLVEATAAALREERATRLCVAGARLARVAQERGLPPPAAMLRAPASVAGLPAVAAALARKLAEPLVAGDVRRVVLVAPRPVGALGWRIEQTTVVPVDPAPLEVAARRPRHHLPPERLLEALIVEHLRAQVTRAVVDAFHVEQAQRLTTLDGMRHELDERLTELRRLDRRFRQEAITIELLDVVGGARMLDDAAGWPASARRP